MNYVSRAKARIRASKRGLIVAGLMATTAMSSAVPADAAPAGATSRRTSDREVAVKNVTFRNGDIDVAGHIYLPADFDARRKYASIVVLHPAGGVKEQTSGLYAQRLAAEGFVTLAFDASHQGASGGEPRFLENPVQRVEDVRAAVDYLTTLAFVDADRIGALGICAGSGYAIKATTLDRRIKAVATVSAVDFGLTLRKGWEGNLPLSEQLKTLENVAAQRTAEAAGADPVYVNYVPEKIDATTHRDMREAHEYYRTPRGYMHASSQNKMLLTSLDKLLAFSAFDQVDTLLTQPLLVIAGSDAGSRWQSEELFGKAKQRDKELFIIKGATHMDLYAGEHVAQALQKLSPFYEQEL